MSELEDLLRVGPVMAAKILEHRNRYGPFRVPEHLLIVDGISEKHFRELRPYIDTR
jgi:DNA uptake protein ComE-like DNA-binding protein